MKSSLSRSLGLVSLLLLCMSVALLQSATMMRAALVFFTAPQAEQGITLLPSKDNIFFCLGDGTFSLGNITNDSTINLSIFEYPRVGTTTQITKAFYSANAQNRLPNALPALTAFEKGKIYHLVTDRTLTFQCGVGLVSGTTGTNAARPAPSVATQDTVTNPSVVVPQGQHPLFLTLNDPATFVKTGDTVIMVLTMKNIGQVELDNVGFSINLPDGYVIPTGGATGNCVGNDTNVTCTGYILGQNESMSFSFPFVVQDSAACGTQTAMARGNGQPKDNPSLSPSQSNVATWNVTCPGVTNPSGNSQGATPTNTTTQPNTTTQTQAPSSAAPTITATSPFNDKVSVELRTTASVKAPGSMDMRMVIRNKTNTALSGISYSMPARLSGTASVQPGQGCAIVGSAVICSNISIPAGSAYTATQRYSVAWNDCTIPPALHATVQKISAYGTPDLTVGTDIRWQWDCTGSTTVNNWAEISGNPPTHVTADLPFTWNMTVRNTSVGGINYWLSMAIPANTNYEPIGGCGQSGPNLMCGGDVLTPGKTQSTTIGTLTFPKSLCGQDIDLGTVRAINALGGGQIVQMGETQHFFTHVDCPVTVQASSAASSTPIIIIDDTFSASSAFSAAASSAAPSQPLSIILTGPSALQPNATAQYNLAIKNISSLNLQNVSFSFVFPSGISTDAVSNSDNCRINSMEMACANIVFQSQFGTNYTLPIKTLGNLPCTTLPLKVRVEAIGMIMESNTLSVQGCGGETPSVPTSLMTILNQPLGYLPKNTAQSLQMTVVTSNKGFSDGVLHAELPAGMNLSFPVNTFNAGTCTTSNNTMDCTGINRDPSKSVIYSLPFFISDAVNCGAAEYKVTFSYTEEGVRKELTKSPIIQLCGAATTATGPINQFSISAGNGVCATSDCRKVTIPVTLKNTSPNTATNVLISAKLDTSWGSGSLNGATCQIVDTTDRIFDCPGGPYLTIPAKSEATYSLMLMTTAPCPIYPARTAVLLQSAPASIFEEDYSDNSVYATIPAPCQNVVASASSSSAPINSGTGYCCVGDSCQASVSCSATLNECLASCGQHSSQSSAVSNVSSSRPLPLLQSIVVKDNNVTFTYTSNTQTCAHLLNSDKQITHSQNIFCDPQGPVTVPLSQMNSLFAVGRSFILCDGNNSEFCSNPVTVTQEAPTPPLIPVQVAAPTIDLSIAQDVAGMNGNTCMDSACSKLLVPVAIHNKGTGQAPDLRISATVDASWNTVTFLGLQCAQSSTIAPTGKKIFDCRGITIAGNLPNGIGMGMVLSRTTPCPVSNFKPDAVIQFTPGTQYAISAPNNALTTNLPVPCLGSTVSSRASSSAPTIYIPPSNPTSAPKSSSAPNLSIPPYIPVSSFLCGNGKVEAPEICDDGNKIDTDACKNNCTKNFNPQKCGNGVREGTEECDDGNQDKTDGCDYQCHAIALPAGSLTLDDVSVETTKDRTNGMLSISGKVSGLINPNSQMLYMYYDYPNSFPATAIPNAATFNFSTPVVYNKTYHPSIILLEHVNGFDHIITQKDLSPVTITPPEAGFSTKEHYGMFVTNHTVSGNFKIADPAKPGSFLTGTKAADQLCNLSAQEAGLSAPGTSVWHSTISNPHRQTFPLYNMRNEILALTEADLWSLQRNSLPATITNAFGVDVNGKAWTGSDGTGKVGTENCSGWSTNLMPYRGSIGTINGGGGEWYQSGIQNCPSDAYLYCVNDLTQ